MNCANRLHSSGNFFDSESSSSQSSSCSKSEGHDSLKETPLYKSSKSLHPIERDSNGGNSPFGRSLSSSDEDEWNSFDLTQPQLLSTSPACDPLLQNCMFMPEPLIRVELAEEKPKLQLLSVDDLPPGKMVWVGDENGLEVYMKNFWNMYYDRICNGQQMGIVRRHSKDMTLVAFHDDVMDLTFALTLPRSCLSTNRNEFQKPPNDEKESVRTKNFSSYIGKSRNRGTTCSSRESLLANQLFYEAVSVSAIRTYGCPSLAKALEDFHLGFISKALTEVNSLIDAPYLYPSRLVDVVLLRSRIFVFQNKYVDALRDARRCISLEPRWVRGYLSAARAFCGLGSFDEAHEMIVKANSILPFTTDLRHIMELNTYLRNEQKLLKKKNLFLSLDHLYRKRIQPLSSVHCNEVILMEAVSTVVVDSLFAMWPENRCKHCLKLKDASCSEHLSLSTVENMGDDNAEDLFGKAVRLDNCSKLMNSQEEREKYCSVKCYKAAKDANQLRGQFNDSIQRAHVKLKSMASMIIDSRPFEITNLAIYLFFLVVQQHKHLLATVAKRRRSVADFIVWSRGTEPPLGQRYTPALNAALRHLGFFPLISGQMGDFVRTNAITVYDILIESMSMEEKKMYNTELFLGLNRYIHTYYVSANLEKSPEEVEKKFFCIPRFVGSIWGRSEIEWLARVEIDSGNWNSDIQYSFSLRTATNCSIELVELHSRNVEELAKVISATGETTVNDDSFHALALVARKEIDPYSLLVPN